MPKPVGIYAPEYPILFTARASLQHAGDHTAIEKAQYKLLSLRLVADSRALEKESDDLLYALELRKAEKLVAKKSWKAALGSFSRGLNGINSLRWVLYWNENSSKALSTVCNRDKKRRDEDCLAIAKRVLDVFPKAANETKILRELPPAEAPAGPEVTGDRLSQTYSERFEKDEEAFVEVLTAFLEYENSDVIKKAKTFIEDFPKSMLRFRAAFLIAETHWRKNQKKDAEPYYQMLVDQSPISYYGLVAAERLGVSLRQKVKKEPLMIDPENFNLSSAEKQSLLRAQGLVDRKHLNEVVFELDALSRTRFYTTDQLIYLMGFATHANQNLFTFKLASELLQRRYETLLQTELLEMIFPDRFQKEIEEQAKMNEVDPVLIASLIKQESGFRADILSASGAIGLMQIMPFTAIDVKKDLRFPALREPATNIAVGTKYLGGLLERYDENPVFALAAYNAGPHRVAKWRKEAKPDWGMIEFIEAIPFKETRDYVMSILRNRYWYQHRKGLIPASVFDGWTSIASPPSSPSPSAGAAAK